MSEIIIVEKLKRVGWFYTPCSRGHSILIKACHTCECTMPNFTEENSVQLVVLEEDVTSLI